MPVRPLNLYDVLVALNQGIAQTVPLDVNEITDDLITGCGRVIMSPSWCNKGVRLISGSFLWDHGRWNQGNWDSAYANYAAIPQPGYLNAVLASRPYAYWRLGESGCAGVIVYDSAGNNDGTPSGALLFGVSGSLAPGDPDRAMQFYTGGRITVPSFNSALDPLVVSIEAWVKPQLPVGTSSLFAVPGAYSLQIDGSGHILLGNEVGGSLTSVTVLTPDVWYYVVGVIQGSSSSIYINGAIDQVGSAAIGATGDTAYIGAESTTMGFFTGVLDEVAIYGRALTTLEIEGHFASRTQVPNKVGENSVLTASYASVTLPALVWGAASGPYPANTLWNTARNGWG